MSRAADFPKLLEQLRSQCREIISRYEQPRSALLPLVHLFQEHEGYVSHEAMRAVAEMLALTPAVVESTVSFYTLFYRKPVGKYMLQPCRGLACALNGAENVMTSFREQLGVGSLQTTPDGVFSYEEVECLAACDRAPCMQVNLQYVYDLTPQKAGEIVASLRSGTFDAKPLPQTDAPDRTWSINQDSQVSMGEKSFGAQDQPDPNNAGGLDRDGVIMLDRILADELRFRGRTKERLATIEPAIAAVIEGADR